MTIKFLIILFYFQDPNLVLLDGRDWYIDDRVFFSADVHARECWRIGSALYKNFIILIQNLYMTINCRIQILDKKYQHFYRGQ